MKKTVLLIAMLPLAASFADKKPEETPRPFYPMPQIEEEKRFRSCENTGGSGFYWLDTGSADVWLFDTVAGTWNFLGSPRGSNDGAKGTYELLSDKTGGAYLLNTRTGEGWWWTASGWKTIGAPSRRIKPPKEPKDD